MAGHITVMIDGIIYDSWDCRYRSVYTARRIPLEISDFRKFEDRLLDNYEFISVNKELMYVDEDGVWHAILVTAKEVDYGIVVQSEGYDYARYAAFISKEGLEV